MKNSAMDNKAPRHKKWLMFARPCLTCDEDTHCQKNCTKKLQNLKELAREEPEYQNTVWDFLAGMPFEYNLQGEVNSPKVLAIPEVPTLIMEMGVHRAEELMTITVRNF